MQHDFQSKSNRTNHIQQQPGATALSQPAVPVLLKKEEDRLSEEPGTLSLQLRKTNLFSGEMPSNDKASSQVTPYQLPVQQKVNNTGMPDGLKSGIEQLSGLSMDDVRVHYNSDRPAQLQAYAYAQGTDIHLGAGQEKHLAHEAWHVVQQKQGRVQPTGVLSGSSSGTDNVVQRVKITFQMLTDEAEKGREMIQEVGGQYDQEVFEQSLLPEPYTVERILWMLLGKNSEFFINSYLGLGEKDRDGFLDRKRNEVLKPGAHTISFRVGQKTMVGFNFKIPAPVTTVTTATASQTPTTPTVKEHNTQQIDLFGKTVHIMRSLGIGVTLYGGAAVTIAAESPRKIKDLDFRTNDVAVDFDSVPGAELIKAINELFIKEFGPGVNKPFAAYDDVNVKMGIQGVVQGTEISFMRVYNPDLITTPEGPHVTVEQGIFEKAHSFVFRSNNVSKSKDIFDILWSMDKQGLTPGALKTRLDSERGIHYTKELERRKTVLNKEASLADEFAVSLQKYLTRGLDSVMGEMRNEVYPFETDKGMEEEAQQKAKDAYTEEMKKMRGNLMALADAFEIKTVNKPNKREPVIIMQAGNMTGDMFAVSALLALNPFAHVVIIGDGSGKDKSAQMKAFYLAHAEEERVHTLDVNTLDVEGIYGKQDNSVKSTKATATTGDNDVEDVMEEESAKSPMAMVYTGHAGRSKMKLPYDKLSPALPTSYRDIEIQRSLAYSTSEVAKIWKGEERESRETIREKFGVTRNLEKYQQVRTFLLKKGIPESGPYTVFWLRFSGKKGGPHAQHDTSFTGLRQMMDLAKGAGKIILTGDQPLKETISTQIQAQHYDLVSFWDSSEWKDQFPKSTRQDQFLLFDYMQYAGGVRHLGFRSGNLEAYALLGHNVRYMEEETNLNKKRMEAWHSDEKDPQGINYNRIQIKGRMPSLTGQWMVLKALENKKEIRPPWIADWGKKVETLKEYSLNTRGFEEDDLGRIGTYLQQEIAPGLKTDMEYVTAERDTLNQEMVKVKSSLIELRQKQQEAILKAQLPDADEKAKKEPHKALQRISAEEGKLQGQEVRMKALDEQSLFLSQMQLLIR